MTIDEAIALLKKEKANGIKNVIIAWWSADQFDRPDDDAWAHAADVVERKHDWSDTHDELEMSLDLYTRE